MGIKSKSFVKTTALLLGVVTAGTALYWFGEKNARDGDAVYHTAVVGLKNVPHKPGGWDPEGYWVGDVTELYRLGFVSKEVAEADVAPLKPLVDRPKPFRGYSVVAMETCEAPVANGTEEHIVLKGRKRCKEAFAFCIYPSESNDGTLPVYLVCPWAIYRKQSDGNNPILIWPKDIRRGGIWWIVD